MRTHLLPIASRILYLPRLAPLYDSVLRRFEAWGFDFISSNVAQVVTLMAEANRDNDLLN
ncbi:MAG: hypothetical protein HC827_01605 [Cyanobacteria bacterium RM1_2_2]|nr:hypothetical protein [Cyanobacteria bacterium RM1_2_2]